MTMTPAQFWTPRVAHADPASGQTRPQLLAVLAWTQTPDNERDLAWVARGTDLLADLGEDELLLLLRLAPGGMSGMGWARHRPSMLTYAHHRPERLQPEVAQKLADTVATLRPFQDALVARVARAQTEQGATLSPLVEELVHGSWLDWQDRIQRSTTTLSVSTIPTPTQAASPVYTIEREQHQTWNQVVGLLAPAAEWLATTPITPGSPAEEAVIAWLTSPKRAPLIVEMLLPQASTLTPAILDTVAQHWPQVSRQLLTRRLPWGPAPRFDPPSDAAAGPDLLPMTRWLTTLRQPRPLNVARARGWLEQPGDDFHSRGLVVTSTPRTPDADDLTVHDHATLRTPSELVEVLRVHVTAPPRSRLGTGYYSNREVEEASWPGWYGLERKFEGTDPVLADVLLQLEVQDALADPTIDAALADLCVRTLPLPRDPLAPDAPTGHGQPQRVASGALHEPSTVHQHAVLDLFFAALEPVLTRRRGEARQAIHAPVGPELRRLVGRFLRTSPDFLRTQRPTNASAIALRDPALPLNEREMLAALAVKQMGRPFVLQDRVVEIHDPMPADLLPAWHRVMRDYVKLLTEQGMIGEGKENHDVATAILMDPRTPLDVLHTVAASGRWADPALRAAIARHPLGPTDPALRPILRRVRDPRVLVELLETADDAELAVLTARLLETPSGAKLWLERVEASATLRQRLDRRLLRPLLLAENQEVRTRAIALAGTLQATMTDAPLPSRARPGRNKPTR